MSELMDVPLVHIYIVIGCLYLAPQCCSSGKGREAKDSIYAPCDMLL